jgi:O-antigen/teichoic acid export membrane protein
MTPFDARGTFRPNAGGNELRRLAVRGAVATVSASGLALAAQVISTVVLARLLSPADFGVVAMVTTFSLLLANVGLNGFTEAIIQFEEMDHYTASNLFWLNSGAGLVLAIAFIASGSGILGAGGRNRCAAGQRDDRGLVALQMDSEFAPAYR